LEKEGREEGGTKGGREGGREDQRRGHTAIGQLLLLVPIGSLRIEPSVSFDNGASALGREGGRTGGREGGREGVFFKKNNSIRIWPAVQASSTVLRKEGREGGRAGGTWIIISEPTKSSCSCELTHRI